MYLASLTTLDTISASAVTPDQLLPYVRSISDAKSRLINGFLVHTLDAHAVLVAYNSNDMHSTHGLDAAIAHLNTCPEVSQLSVLAPIRPHTAPTHATSSTDNYYFLDLPLNINTLKNAQSMCRRAHQNIHIRHEQGAWSSAHQELMLHYVRRTAITKEMSTLFQRLGHYCTHTPDAHLFSAYDSSNALCAFNIADFTSIYTAFYMFSMRHKNAPIGVSDALLHTLLNTAHNSGYKTCNLGLGINKGITFFKKKWGAVPQLPFVQTTWQTRLI